MTKVKIYSAQVCPYAQRTRLLLLEKGVDFELIEIDLANKPDWFEDVSPYSKVPVVVDGDTRVYESSIINEYLEEAYPEPALMPSDPGRRALARIWIDYANVKYTPSLYKFLMDQDDEARASLRADAVAVLRFMETEGLRKLSDGPYWMGEELSLVDLAYYPFFERLCVLEHYRDFAIPEDCPRLKAWIETMRFRPSVKKIENPPDYYIERYARYASGKAAGVTARKMKSA
jgi:glutathione S-transferase